jgi:hypothetical protein
MSIRLSVRPSVRMEQLGYHWTDFHEISYLSVFENLWDNNNGTLYENQYKFLITTHSLLPRMRNVSEKCFEKSKHILCLVNFFPENRAVYEIM